MPDPFDLTTTHVHLGLGATATPIENFEWSPSFLEAYERDHAADGAEGRLVSMFPQEETWTFWERHPAGEEVVVLMSGRVDLIREVDGVEELIELRPGTATVNPKGVWHRAVVLEPGVGLFITPGTGTEHRPFEVSDD
ncbi:MAG TPA: cupin [Acidimicrobiales bacterium]|jgi:mannose-6-phosphate isomerase-like protein (cupin superfamily)